MLTVKQDPNKGKIDAYMVTFITSDGEKFRKIFFPTEIPAMRKYIGQLGKQNNCLSIRISSITSMVTLERGMTTEPYTYTRTINGQTSHNSITDITKIFRRKEETPNESDGSDDRKNAR